METKIYGYAARDLTVSADGRVLDDSVRIHYTRPHLRSMQSFEGGEVKTTYQKQYLNGMFKSVTVTLDGRKWTIRSEEEADEILEAYSDILK